MLTYNDIIDTQHLDTPQLDTQQIDTQQIDTPRLDTEILDTNIKGEIIKITYTLNYDGYDRYGPEIYINDCYVVTKYKNKYYLWNFHKENWYNNNDEKYYLYEPPKIISRLKFLKFNIN